MAKTTREVRGVRPPDIRTDRRYGIVRPGQEHGGALGAAPIGISDGGHAYPAFEETHQVVLAHAQFAREFPERPMAA
jgi:hypothetical protein